MVNIGDTGFEEHEGDFVIFNPQKGILCIEAKAGGVAYENGRWFYGNGIEMKHGGPFRQADEFKHTLMNKFDNCGCGQIKKRCKFLHAVWFPSINRSYFEGKALPTNADMRMMIFRDSADNIEQVISDIFDIEIFHTKTALGATDTKIILNKILAPQYNVVSIAQVKHDNRETVFGRLLKEQIMLLNYLEEQDRAVINGMAGTGKTLMAIEKAKRHAMNNEKVLFLCYNRFLMEHLRESYPFDNVEYYTIDAFACKMCESSESDLDILAEKLEECYYEEDFLYKHIIIDEGQDFGQKKMEESNIITSLQMLVLDNDFNQGTFYIFYDKNQLVQGSKIPDYILDADCKLTLYRNCRNTANIATTSVRLLNSTNKPKLKENAVVGDLTEMYIEYDNDALINAVDDSIKKNIENGMEDIVILTCATEEKSFLSEYASDGVYRYNGNDYKFTTCRKFKGLEADAVIIIDVDYNSFSEYGDKLTYVGTSRAKFRLSVIAKLNEDECCALLDKIKVKSGRRPAKSLAAAYNAKYVTADVTV